MTRMGRLALAVLVAVVSVSASIAVAEGPGRDQARYVDKLKDPVIAEIQARDEALAAAAQAKTDEILASETAAAKERDEPKQRLRFDLSELVKPSGPEAFTTVAWHLPPTPQYLTGTCWSFSATSFLESEIHRVHGKDIKLSEMWIAYWEFVRKTRGYVASRGETLFDDGSETAAAMEIVRTHGIVPRAAYEGVVAEDGRFDHDPMVARIRSFLAWCKAENYWDEDVIVAMVRRILDTWMGRPPETVDWQGATLTPEAFRDQVGELDPDDYVSLMSTLAVPFWTRGEYAVPDNWWHDASYVNLPLDDWYRVILDVVDNGGSLVIGGDTSESGMNGPEDVAVVPTFDIPGEYIDQSARELRFANGTTTDDHGIHLVGHMVLDGHDWFLIKDSNRSSRDGAHKGYYFYRDDYVRLKMLTITVPKDRVKEILDLVDGAGE
jgi:bleomycin hydrolase